MPTVPIYDFDTDFVLKVRQTIRVVQSDIGREFVCHAKFNGQAWDLTGFTGTVLGVKPDGNATDTTATIDEDEFKFTLTEQMAAVAGAYEIFLTVENGSDVKIQAPVLLCVLEGADGVISESALGALTELLQASQDALEDASDAATAAAASAEDAEEAADLATAAADSILVDVTDRTPYLLRQSGGGVETGDREYDTIVGGTVAWNQLVQNGNFVDQTGWSRGSGVSAIAVSDNTATLTIPAGTTYNKYIQPPFVPVTGTHVYMISAEFQSSTMTSAFIQRSLNGIIKVAESRTSLSSGAIVSGVFKETETGNARFYFRFDDTATQAETTGTLKNCCVFDLTKMFGSTIADYIYSLEQATAGAGVAWFRSLFPKPYYEYNAGELMSVSGVSAHVMRDADDNIIGNYPLDDSLTLRGILKLDGGKLYYDGDTYESDGTVTRKYGIVVFDGSLDESWAVQNNCFVHDITLRKSYNAATSVNVLVTNRYPSIGVRYRDSITDKNCAAVVRNKQIAIYDSSYVDANAFIESLTSNPLIVVYELATTTTETAEPFQTPQVVDHDGTEQYVTDSIVPVGHETIYRTNLLDNLNNILKAPTADGTYTMKVTVSNGEATYFWD